jgi:uncharacterized protein (TIGR02246 family)
VDVQADIRAIEEIRRRVEAAENAGDAEYCADLLADDAVIMVPDFPVRNGRDACAAFLRELMPGLLEVFDRRITYTGSEVRILDDIAFDRGEFSFTIRPRSGGVASRVTGKYFWLYARAADGGWRLSRAVVTRDDAEEPQPPECRARASRIAFHLALPFAGFLGIAEVVRNWGDWGFWPFWVVDYLAVGLLLFGWHGFGRERAGASVWLAGAWGFTCAMFYMSFFSHIATLDRPDHGPIEHTTLIVIIGALFALTVFAFVCSLVGVRTREHR